MALKMAGFILPRNCSTIAVIKQTRTMTASATLTHQQSPKTSVPHRRKIGKMGQQHQDAGRIEQDNDDRHKLPSASDDAGLNFHHDLFGQAVMQGLEDQDLEDHYPAEGHGAQKMDCLDEEVMLAREDAHLCPCPAFQAAPARREGRLRPCLFRSHRRLRSCVVRVVSFGLAAFQMLEPREQHIVLEVDMLHDVVDQFAGPGIERLPRSTCAFGQDEAVRNGLQMAQKLAMPIMVVTHLRDRELSWGTVLLPHQREELCLFVVHMLLKFGLQRIEGIGEPPRRLGMTCMDSLDFSSQANELRQLT